jgi:hypothetical protein
MNFNETVQRAVELYKLQATKNLLAAASKACEEAGEQWNVTAVQSAAYKIIFG